MGDGLMRVLFDTLLDSSELSDISDDVNYWPQHVMPRVSPIIFVVNEFARFATVVPGINEM